MEDLASIQLITGKEVQKLIETTRIFWSGSSPGYTTRIVSAFWMKPGRNSNERAMRFVH